MRLIIANAGIASRKGAKVLFHFGDLRRNANRRIHRRRGFGRRNIAHCQVLTLRSAAQAIVVVAGPDHTPVDHGRDFTQP